MSEDNVLPMDENVNLLLSDLSGLDTTVVDAYMKEDFNPYGIEGFLLDDAAITSHNICIKYIKQFMRGND